MRAAQVGAVVLWLGDECGRWWAGVNGDGSCRTGCRMIWLVRSMSDVELGVGVDSNRTAGERA